MPSPVPRVAVNTSRPQQGGRGMDPPASRLLGRDVPHEHRQRPRPQQYVSSRRLNVVSSKFNPAVALLLHFQVTTLGKLFTHVCLCHQPVEFGNGQGAVISCG